MIISLASLTSSFFPETLMWGSVRNQKQTAHVKPLNSCFTYIFQLFYLFLERGREGEREGEKRWCGCLSHAPCWGPGSQPRHVP